jgi:hypothetical protein
MPYNGLIVRRGDQLMLIKPDSAPRSTGEDPVSDTDVNRRELTLLTLAQELSSTPVKHWLVSQCCNRACNLLVVPSADSDG